MFQLCLTINCATLSLNASISPPQVTSNWRRIWLDRQKEIRIQLCKDVDNYSSAYHELHAKLFGEQLDGIRMIWEYVNMMYLDYNGNEFLMTYKSEFDNFKNFQICTRSLKLCRRKSNKQSFHILFGIRQLLWRSE